MFVEAAGLQLLPRVSRLEAAFARACFYEGSFSVY